MERLGVAWWVEVLLVSSVAFLVFAALAVHAAGCLEHVLRIQTSEGARLEDLIH